MAHRIRRFELRVMQSRRAPRPVRELLTRRENGHLTEALVQHLRQGDETERVATCLLSGQSARLAKLWVAEVFTLLDLPEFTKELSELDVGSGRGSLAQDFSQWFSESRRTGRGGLMSLPFFRREGLGVFLRMLSPTSSRPGLFTFIPKLRWPLQVSL